jgi:L1 cell adhesion molecule like protein
MDPDEAVTYGSTVQRAIIKLDKSEEIKDILSLNVTPLSLGIETTREFITLLIPQNTTIPIKKSQI